MGGAEVQLHSFLTSALDRGDWWTSCIDRFTPGKEPKHQLNRRLGWFQNQFGRFSGQYKLSCICRDSNPEQSSLWLVAILTTLSQLKFLYSAIFNYLLGMQTGAQVTKFFPTFYKINGSLSHTTGIINSVHTTTCYFCEINLNVIALTILQSSSFPSGFLVKIFVCNSHLYQTQNNAIILPGFFLSTGNYQEHNNFQPRYIIIKIL
jgi:hypothetical protein